MKKINALVMKGVLIFILLCFLGSFIYAQNKPGSSFNGTNKGNPNVCQGKSKNMMTDKDVENMITKMLGKLGTKNRFIVMPCASVENCQATLYDGKPYILYNPEFLNKVKRLNFAQKDLPDADEKDWEILTILAHELGHHVNHHLDNPLPDAKSRDQELEADETAGFIIYLMGGTLSQAQLIYHNSNISDEGNYLYPPRKQRLEAIAAGYNEAAKNYPKTIVVNPVTTPVTIPVTSTVKKPITEDANPITDIDGNSYQTIKIGEQVWMTENLNVSHFRNGDLIQEVKSDEEWEKYGNEGKPAWCYYDNDPINGDKYGKLYNWYAVNDPRGLAPSSYNISSDEDWEKLVLKIGGWDIAGVNMKNITGWADEGDKIGRGNGTNTSGFAGLPGGFRRNSGKFYFVGKDGFWWSSTESDTTYALFREMFSSNGFVGATSNNKQQGYSVRCLKD